MIREVVETRRGKGISIEIAGRQTSLMEEVVDLDQEWYPSRSGADESEAADEH